MFKCRYVTVGPIHGFYGVFRWNLQNGPLAKGDSELGNDHVQVSTITLVVGGEGCETQGKTR